jgi:hypothetical protein
LATLLDLLYPENRIDMKEFCRLLGCNTHKGGKRVRFVRHLRLRVDKFYICKKDAIAYAKNPHRERFYEHQPDFPWSSQYEGFREYGPKSLAHTSLDPHRGKAHHGGPDAAAAARARIEEITARVRAEQEREGVVGDAW